MTVAQRLINEALASACRGAYLWRRRKRQPPKPVPRPARTPPKGSRNILFITVDQQRFDALGANGHARTRTPVVDRLDAEGIGYRRAHVQNVVCMPSRTTMITGQYPRTHGVFANGVPMPVDAPSVVEELRKAGYRTALLGKAHFDPHLDPTLRFYENRCAAEGFQGPWHGFEHVELATHGPLVGHHYAAWLWEHHRRYVGGFGSVLTGVGGGDTGAPEVAHNPVPREAYHTDWVADRTLAWLREVKDERFFAWMSFPDPHHPFDPPLDEVRARVDWRDFPLPERYLDREHAQRTLAERPRHWLDWYEGRFRNPEGGPTAVCPGELSAAQLREVNAMIHVENELIDEACGRVVRFLEESGLDEHTDIFYTSDHGELQGDYGLLFKGPYHVESLLRVPMIWRPAKSAAVDPATVEEPVGHVDLAPTFCRVAGIDVPEWMEGRPLPVAPGSDRESVVTTFDSQFAPVGMHLETIYRDGLICTRYRKHTTDEGGRFPLMWAVWGAGSRIPEYDGSEGELYDLSDDPLGMTNRWSDPAMRSRRDALLCELDDRLPPARQPPLRVEAPT